MSRPTRQQNHTVSSLLPVITVFAAILLVGVMMILMGSGVYEKVLTSMDENDTCRTASAYLMQKIRAAGSAGAVSAGTLDGCDAIVIQETIDDGNYVTYLYCDDGALKELLVREGNESAGALAGSEVLSLNSMTVTESTDGGSGLSSSLLITLGTADGEQQRLRIALLP